MYVTTLLAYFSTVCDLPIPIAQNGFDIFFVCLQSTNRPRDIFCLPSIKQPTPRTTRHARKKKNKFKAAHAAPLLCCQIQPPGESAACADTLPLTCDPPLSSSPSKKQNCCAGKNEFVCSAFLHRRQSSKQLDRNTISILLIVTIA